MSYTAVCEVGDGFECLNAEVAVENGVYRVKPKSVGPVVFKHSPTQRVICDGTSFNVGAWGGSLYTAWHPEGGHLDCISVEGRLIEIEEGVYIVTPTDTDLAETSIDGYLASVLKALARGRPIFLLKGGSKAGGRLDNAITVGQSVEEAILGKIRDMLSVVAGGASTCLFNAVEGRLINVEVIDRVVKGEIEAKCLGDEGVELR
ncbi:hypothetical protein TCELL_1305 [Thermogladius calderae 1633]|uniref:Uncharacterized protein n=1 Tax=Thermogladius calderae (strain DSM 22663 / VKM B-2946 / 1633) TaxID=1184251 RepID=I3TG40_THEC1|nr:hypothetical protein [Thermogladius calderae]AFK51728.1 hypothetical protein TCELL_1305 [Thermogladius calderae 1633]